MPTLLRPDAIERLRRACLGITVVWFLVGGLSHFIVGTAFFLHIMPPWVPWPLTAIYLSGAIELVLTALLWSPRTRPWAGWGLIAVIFAVSSANVHMWQHPEQFPEAPPWIYSARLVLQVALLWVVWFGTQVPQPRVRTSPST